MVIGVYYIHDKYRPHYIYMKDYCLLAVFYMQNMHGMWPERGNPGPFGHLWSLACEEQFYIIWAMVLPFIMRSSLRRKYVILTSLIGLSFFARIVTSMYPGTFFGMHWHDSLGTNVWKMLLGSSLRILPIPNGLLQRQTAYLGLLGLAGTLYAMVGPQPFDYWSPKYGPGWHDLAAGAESWTDPLSAVSAALIIIGVHGKGRGLWILEGRAVRFAGKISYAWYLWQASILVFSGWQRYYRAIADTGLAFMIAMVSTFLIEEPIGDWYRAYKKTLK
jgi:peptidoglycan/LPS O-acetylase OafA/YrhL